MSDERADATAAAVTPGRRGAHPLVRYLAVRLLVSGLLVFGVTLVTFVLATLVPADPAAAALGEQASSNKAIVAAFRHAQGLDQPLPVQYLTYLAHLLHGNFGTSIQTHNPVAADLAVAFPATAELALCVIVLAVVLGVGLGLVAALTHNRIADQVIRFVSLIGISVPTFWLAIGVYYLFFFLLRIAPGTGRLDPADSPPPPVTGLYTVDAAIAGQWGVFWDAAAHLVLPTLVLTLYTVGLLVRFSRSAVLEVLNADYIRAARAKGLSTSAVVFRYLLRGSLLPILTIVGLAFGSLLSGTVLTEQVFGWGGIGQYAFMASTSLDLPAVLGVGFVVGIVFIATNFAIDVIYGFVDPRVRVG